MPQETYAWFQGMFNTRLAEVYEKRGLEFLKDLRAAGIVAGAKYDVASELIARLEKSCRVLNGGPDWFRDSKGDETEEQGSGTGKFPVRRRRQQRERVDVVDETSKKNEALVDEQSGYWRHRARLSAPCC